MNHCNWKETREEETIIRQYIIKWIVTISKISSENIPHKQYFPLKELR